MAVAVYHEARGENDLGKAYVAKVIKNRSEKLGFPNNFCDVIKQPGQFTFNPNKGVLDKNTYNEIYKISEQVAYGSNQWDDIDDNVLYYHNKSVNPRWGKTVKLYKKVGNHVFYKRIS